MAWFQLYHCSGAPNMLVYLHTICYRYIPNTNKHPWNCRWLWSSPPSTQEYTPSCITLAFLILNSPVMDSVRRSSPTSEVKRFGGSLVISVWTSVPTDVSKNQISRIGLFLSDRGTAQSNTTVVSMPPSSVMTARKINLRIRNWILVCYRQCCICQYWRQATACYMAFKLLAVETSDSTDLSTTASLPPSLENWTSWPVLSD